MKFEEYPKEIQLLITRRTIEAGNEFSKRRFNADPQRDTRSDGFTWNDTPEGSEFWREVLTGDITPFYEKYPKSPFADIAELHYRSVGMKFMITGCPSGGYDDSNLGEAYNIGDIVTLVRDDKSFCPKFATDTGDHHYIYWSSLYPIEKLDVEPTKVELTGYTERPTNVKVGDKFIVTSNRRLDGSIDNLSCFDLKLGLIFELAENDDSSCPYFSGTNSEGRELKSKVLNWGWLSPVTKVEVENSHILNKLNNNGESTSSTSSNVCRPIESDIRSGERYTGQVSCEINLPEIRSRY